MDTILDERDQFLRPKNLGINKKILFKILITQSLFESLIFNQKMCYLKHLREVNDSSQIFDKDVKQESSDVSTPQNTDLKTSNFFFNLPSILDGAYLTKLGALIQKIKVNTSLIESIGEKIQEEESTAKVEGAVEMIEQIPPKVHKDEILSKLFGDLSLNFNDSNFKYKLSMDTNLPTKFYKHRKYSIAVKLMPCTPRTSKIILSSNPLNVCMGIFDKDGNWVNQNILGEPILDGLTQVNLYQGRAEFPRILFNQISSNFPKQKLNIAIYVKPGLDNLGINTQSGPNFIHWNSIKPLILKHVTVLSKKRKKISDDLS